MIDDKKPLSDRKKMILKAIVDAHIELGEPVGSKLLTQNKQFNLSSATIRNEMAELEEMGYLEQPHTSAGRVPSESGYRFYVDSLIARYRMTAAEAAELRSMLRAKITEMDDIFAQATRLASTLTNYTALSVKQRPARLVVRKFECVPLDAQNFILVMITDVGIVKTKHVKLAFEVLPEHCARLAQTLNDCIARVPLDDVTLPVIMEMEKRMAGAEALVSPIVKCVYEACGEISSSDLKLEGINRLLLYPEYYDFDRMREMLSLFESGDDLIRAVTANDTAALRVLIGSENTVKVMDNSTLIYRPVTVAGRVAGVIGIIGPCRMDYSRVITMVDSLSDNIQRLLSGGDGKPPETGEQ